MKVDVTSKLLARIIKDARKEGYVYLEAYPDKTFNELYQEFMGPKRLYQKFGFEVMDEIEDKWIIRKALVN